MCSGGDELGVLHSNCSLCSVKLARAAEALEHADTAVRMRPSELEVCTPAVVASLPSHLLRGDGPHPFVAGWLAPGPGGELLNA